MNRIIVTVFIFLFLSSCDPDVPGEGITLPPMEFAYIVNPDTAYMKVGDTFTMHASISSTLSDGTKLTDGEGEIWFGMSKSENIPRASIEDQNTPLNNLDYHLIIERGG